MLCHLLKNHRIASMVVFCEAGFYNANMTEHVPRPRVHLVSFGHGEQYIARAYCLLHDLAGNYPGARIDVVTLADIHSEFLAACVAKHARGVGLYQWKPDVFLHALRHTRAGDIIVYADGRSGCRGTGPLSWVEALGADETLDLCGWQMDNPERQWSRADLLHALGVSDLQDPIATSGQLAATMSAFRHNPATKTHMQSWRVKMQEHAELGESAPSKVPNHESFRDNRHDQSFFSILTKQAQRDGALNVLLTPTTPIQPHVYSHEGVRRLQLPAAVRLKPFEDIAAAVEAADDPDCSPTFTVCIIGDCTGATGAFEQAGRRLSLCGDFFAAHFDDCVIDVTKPMLCSLAVASALRTHTVDVSNPLTLEADVARLTPAKGCVFLRS